jgi:hypothetical protein
MVEDEASAEGVKWKRAVSTPDADDEGEWSSDRFELFCECSARGDIARTNKAHRAEKHLDVSDDEMDERDQDERMRG